jgi:HEAT repeat protein
VWALRHPDGDRAILAARRLGALGAREAVPALWEIMRGSPDPYLAAVALHALIRIEGVARLQELLESIAKDGPLLQRQVAQEELTKTTRTASASTAAGAR